MCSQGQVGGGFAGETLGLGAEGREERLPGRWRSCGLRFLSCCCFYQTAPWSPWTAGHPPGCSSSPAWIWARAPLEFWSESKRGPSFMSHKLRKSRFFFMCTQSDAFTTELTQHLLKSYPGTVTWGFWKDHLTVISLVTAEWSFPQYCGFMSCLPGQQQNCCWFVVGEDV